MLCSIKNNFIFFLFISIFSIGVKMSWNIGDKKNLFLNLKSKLELQKLLSKNFHWL